MSDITIVNVIMCLIPLQKERKTDRKTERLFSLVIKSKVKNVNRMSEK